MNEQICCPKFDPTNWDNKILDWNDKLFIQANVPTFFYIPIGYGKVMQKLQAQVDKAGAKIEDYLCLSTHHSKWNMELLLAVDKKILDASNVELSGKYYSRVYEGPFKDTGKWMKNFETAMAEKGLTVTEYYMWYTTCPKCAKAYGKNYVVIIGELL